MNKFTHDRSNCPYRRQQRGDCYSSSNGKHEKCCRRINKEPQMSASVTSTSSEKNNMCPFSIQKVCQQMENPELCKNNIRCFTFLSHHLINFSDELQNSVGTNYDHVPESQLDAEQDFGEPIYLKMPVNIRVQVSFEYKEAAVGQNTENPLQPKYEGQCSCALCSTSITRFTQTEDICIFRNGFMPECWCTIKKQQSDRKYRKGFISECWCDVTKQQATHIKTADILCRKCREHGLIPECKCDVTKQPTHSKIEESLDGEQIDDLKSETHTGIADSLDSQSESSQTVLGSEPYDASVERVKNQEEFKGDVLVSEILTCPCNDIESTKTGTCACKAAKLTQDELDSLMERPHSRLSSILFSNKLNCLCDLKSKPIESQKEVYRMVYPQHKDLDICTKCRFDPSPLIDQNDRVFCPGNCGCCLCPWKPRATSSLVDVMRHSKLKVCKCRNRTAMFEDLNAYGSKCSQVSYFDLCPCQEKAEAKHLELYNCEMRDYSKKNNPKLQHIGKEVNLDDVREIVKK